MPAQLQILSWAGPSYNLKLGQPNLKFQVGPDLFYRVRKYAIKKSFQNILRYNKVNHGII